MEYIDEITKKVAGEIADFEKKHSYINGGFATGLARKYAIEAYNQAIRDAAESAEAYCVQNVAFVDEQSILKLLKSDKSFCECGSQKDHDCKYCTSCNKHHSI